MQVFEKKKISDMQIGDACEGFFLLKEAAMKVTSSGKPFMDGKIQDSSGEIGIIFWSYTGDVAQTSVGKIIKIRGKAGEYQGKRQLELTNVRAAVESDNYDLSEIVPVAPINVKDAMARIEELVKTIADPEYQAIAYAMLEQHKRFDTVPAAKGVHHAFIHGLLMHTRFMMETANCLAMLYGSVVNRDLLLTATLCHDLEKENEFNVSELGLVSEYAVEGRLIGHLVMGSNAIDKIGTELGIDPQKIMLLKHAVLAHHGIPDWDAAVRPQTAEAILLHYIDNIDAKMEATREEFEVTPVGSFTKKNIMDRPVYRHF